MARIAILADSGCQIEFNQYENQGIYIVPLCITMKKHTYLDQKEITSLEVFETMEKEDVMVMTSQPSTGELVNVLQKIKDDGYDEVIGLPIATGLSSTLNGMKVAAEMVDIPITLVDTKGTAGNQKYLVFTAAKFVQEGKSVSEIQQILEEMVEQSGTIIMAPNLEHLKKGGRITPAVALLASMLKIVPVMELNYELGGKIDILGKVRTLSKAKASLVNRMIELGVNAKEYKITVEHVLCESSAMDVKQMILEKIGDVELELRELPAVVGAHMGVGGIGVQYIKKYEG
ncbi:DegV family protein [Allocoprobacillus halotolerans]|uniref:DegV family protein n=1 Tax=Allocoprobacillus halotolerans TaxID=2944914 RepID=A0ABY5I7N0_9FIRM|nr:DegV family protein [Allocoprobacillus halotolerans]UTY39932.1 DegV family protein [Allocoprobacillus halotolerans]